MKSQITDTSSIAIIGGGASGLMCAVTAAQNGGNVTLFEKNKSEKLYSSEKFYDNAYLGKKLLITGKGRCNLTNDCTIEEFMANVPCNGKFLFAAFNAFPPQKVMEFFENCGTKLKVERGNRVFPVSDRSLDILNCLKCELKTYGVNVKNQKVASVRSDGDKFEILTEDGNIQNFDSVVISTGGVSYPQTGSDGDGYSFAKEFGHTIIPPKPSLVPLECEDDMCRALQGLSLRNVTFNVIDIKNGKKIYSDFGEMLFTHFGISGPLVLSASAHIKDLSVEDFAAYIDLKPALDEKTLDKRLLSDFQKYPNRNIINALSDLLPSKLIPIFLNACSISEYTKPNSITKKQRADMISALKQFKVKITALRPVSEAIITSGGVSVKEINSSTMSSKLVPNLYFAGEVIDVDAYTGGFNLQIAFCTGYLAGKSAVLNKKNRIELYNTKGLNAVYRRNGV